MWQRLQAESASRRALCAHLGGRGLGGGRGGGGGPGVHVSVTEPRPHRPPAPPLPTTNVLALQAAKLIVGTMALRQQTAEMTSVPPRGANSVVADSGSCRLQYSKPALGPGPFVPRCVVAAASERVSERVSERRHGTWEVRPDAFGARCHTRPSSGHSSPGSRMCRLLQRRC